MVILQINKFFHEKGGSERYFFALSGALTRRGHDVAHFAMQHPRNLPSPFARHFAPQREYETGAAWRAVGAGAGFIRSRAAASCLRGLLGEVRPDVAHLHNIYHQLTPSIIGVLDDARIPMVMTLHDYKLVCPSYSLFTHGRYCRRCRHGSYHHAVVHRCGGTAGRSVLLAVESFWQRWTRVYDRVDRFVAPSAFMRGIMLDSGIPESRVVHVPPFAPDRAAAGANGAPVDAAWPARFVAFVGRLSPEKGGGVLLEAMQALPHVPLVVFGEGPAGDDWRRRARALANVTFAGHASRATLDAAMERACALVLPTVSPENAPLAVLEAASADVPVIVSDMGGLPELAERLDGTVVPAHDAAALARAIDGVWRDAAGARRRAAAAWQRSRAHFGESRHVDGIEAVYREAVAARAANGVVA